MRIRRVFVALALSFPLAVRADDPDAGRPAGDGWKAVDLVYTPCPKEFPYRTFEGGTSPVTGTSLPFPSRDGRGVVVVPEEFAIGVDCNGDGKVDERLKSDGATVSVPVVYPDGFVAPYLVRFARNRQKQWQYERAGFWKGAVKGDVLALIDNNNNGTYDEYGKDAVAVGATAYAIPLSKVVPLGGRLHELRVAPSGRRAWVREYEGETGRLDVVTGYRTQGRLLAAVFRCGDLSVQGVGKEKSVTVPAGAWELVGGEVGMASGSQRAMFRKGKMAAIEVKAGGDGAASWGMDLKLTFKAVLDKGTLTIKGIDVQAWGAGGEEYYGFRPIELTPDIIIWSGAGGTSTKPLLQGGCPICPQGNMDDFRGSVGDEWVKVQLVEKKFQKIFGTFSSDVVDVR